MKVTYDVELAQFYMWAQTSCTVMLAVFIATGRMSASCCCEVYFAQHVGTFAIKNCQRHVSMWKWCCAGYHDKGLTLDCTESTLRIQPQGSPPVIDRILEYRADISRAFETHK